jgi:hypothetical protein
MAENPITFTPTPQGVCWTGSRCMPSCNSLKLYAKLYAVQLQRYTYGTRGMGLDARYSSSCNPLKLYAKLYAVQLTVHVRQGVWSSTRSSCMPRRTLRPTSRSSVVLAMPSCVVLEMNDASFA